MHRRLVTLSTGARVPVTIGAPQRNYYPDLPHCCVCDQAQGWRHPLWTCDAAVTGKANGRCGRYVCAAHRGRLAGVDVCPAHNGRRREAR